jgi:hypothetical protein
MKDTDDRDARLDAAYRGSPRDEPPAELDERIRAAARRAVSMGPQRGEAPSQRSWAARWRVPVSLAATVVIVVTLTVMMQDEESRRPRFDERASAAPPATDSPKSVTAPAEAGRLQERAAPAPVQPPQPRVPPTEERRTAAERQAAPAATEAPAKLESPATSGALSKERENRQADVAPASQAVQAAPTVPAAGAPPPVTAPAPASPPAPAAARELMRAAPSAAPDAAARRDRALADRPDRMEREAATEAKTRSPEAWLEEIRRLKAQGRDAEAASELAAFRKRYPDFTLPPDLAK